MPMTIPLARPTRRVWFVSVAFVAAAALTAAVLQPRSHPLVLDNVRIIDGTGAAPIEKGRIVVEGEKIVRAGSADATAAPDGAERVDLAGKTVIPGLIDLHFHIENDPRMALR